MKTFTVVILLVVIAFVCAEETVEQKKAAIIKEIEEELKGISDRPEDHTVTYDEAKPLFEEFIAKVKKLETPEDVQKFVERYDTTAAPVAR